MSTIHENIETLCQESGIKPGKMCADLKMSRSLISDLRYGRKKGITAETAKRIADYFGVSIDRVIGKEKTPAESERVIDDKDLFFALWGGDKHMDADDLQAVKDYAEFLRAKKQMTGK